MKVVITPAFPVFSNEDMLQWKDMLTELKEEGFDAQMIPWIDEKEN